MSDWVTVTKKQSKEVSYSKNYNLPSKVKNTTSTNVNPENNGSHLSFQEITDIFEDEYGDYIEKEIVNVCGHNKKYSDLLRKVNACDIEFFFLRLH